MSDHHKPTQPAAALLATLFQQTYSAEELQALLHDQQSQQSLIASLSTQVFSLLQEDEEEPHAGQALSGLKIDDYAGQDVLSAPDRLRGTAAENKAVFDRLVKEIVSPTLNAMIDILQSAEGAAEIGFAAEPETLSATSVAEALAELYRRSYSREESDAQLQEKDDTLYRLLHREKGAPSSIAGVAHAAGDIGLVAGQGITINPDPAGKQIKITATGETIAVPHAREHLPGGIDELTAEIAYDARESGLPVETVQGALDELARKTALRAHDTVQEALDGLQQKIGHAPGDVTGFRADAGDDGIALYWQDPADISLQGIPISHWAYTRIVRREDRYPAHENDGHIVLDNKTRGQYATTPYVDTGLDVGQQYYYQAFPISDLGIVNCNTANRVTAITKSMLPGAVQNFTVRMRNGKIALAWQDPEDQIGPISVHWGGTRVLRKTEGYPDNELDGELVIDSTVRNQYQNGWLIDENFAYDTAYYYRAFPYTTKGVVNREAQSRATITPRDYVQLSYTGASRLVESTHPQLGTKRFYMTLTSSGTLSTDTDTSVDVFLVGGGGNGGGGSQGASGGYSGGGGYTKTELRRVFLLDSPVAVVVGAGGGGTSSFGTITVAGGSSKNGGSGGGGWRAADNGYPGADGGSDGANGLGSSNSGGRGQGTTTRAFGGDVSPFTAMLYSGGGGGGGGHNSKGGGYDGGAGGSGGGGKGADGVHKSNGNHGSNGTANTGGGGGGGGSCYHDYTPGSGGTGGSGIVIVRWGDWSK